MIQQTRTTSSSSSTNKSARPHQKTCGSTGKGAYGDSIFMLLVRWRPLVVIVIIMTAKEEVRSSSIMNESLQWEEVGG